MSKNRFFRVSNEISQVERRTVVANDRRIHKGVSYSQLTESEAAIPRGRWTAASETRVVGSESAA